MEQLLVEMLHFGYLCLWLATADEKITVLQLFIAYNRCMHAWSYVKTIV